MYLIAGGYKTRAITEPSISIVFNIALDIFVIIVATCLWLSFSFANKEYKLFCTKCHRCFYRFCKKITTIGILRHQKQMSVN